VNATDAEEESLVAVNDLLMVRRNLREGEQGKLSCIAVVVGPPAAELGIEDSAITVTEQENRSASK